MIQQASSVLLFRESRSGCVGTPILPLGPPSEMQTPCISLASLPRSRGSVDEANRIIRPRKACAGCEAAVQSPLPSRPIERGRPGPGLLAHVLVSKYADHLPLYRQSQIYAREGVIPPFLEGTTGSSTILRRHSMELFRQGDSLIQLCQ